MLWRSCCPSGPPFLRNALGWELCDFNPPPDDGSTDGRSRPGLASDRDPEPAECRSFPSPVCHRCARARLACHWWRRDGEALLVRMSGCCREAAAPLGTAVSLETVWAGSSAL